MSDFNPSQCEVTKAQIVSDYSGAMPEDIAQLITGFEIIQSMDMEHYSGFLEVQDTLGVLEKYPLRAEEYMLLTINSYDLNAQITLYTRIHKISDLVPTESNNGLLYKLHFISTESYEANKRKITQSYEASTSEIANQVFHNHYGKLDEGTREDTLYGKEIELPFDTLKHPLTDSLPLNKNIGKRNFYIKDSYASSGVTIPRYTPAYTMKFLSSISWSSESPSCTFRFFETLENYYFVSDEYFIRKQMGNNAKKFYYGPYGSMDPRDAAYAVNRFEKLQINSKGNDTGSDIFSGAYRSKVLEIDLLRRRVVEHKWNYDDDAEFIDMDGVVARNNSEESQPHTRGFREETFTEENARQFVVYKDFQSAGDIPSSRRPERFIPRIVSNRVSYYHHLNNTSIQVGMKGRFDIRPGEIIILQIPNFDAGTTERMNNHLSGKYMVRTTQHSMKYGVLSTSLTLSKFDWSGTGEIEVENNGS